MWIFYEISWISMCCLWWFRRMSKLRRLARMYKLSIWLYMVLECVANIVSNNDLFASIFKFDIPCYFFHRNIFSWWWFNCTRLFFFVCFVVCAVFRWKYCRSENITLIVDINCAMLFYCLMIYFINFIIYVMIIRYLSHNVVWVSSLISTIYWRYYTYFCITHTKPITAVDISRSWLPKYCMFLIQDRYIHVSHWNHKTM